MFRKIQIVVQKAILKFPNLQSLYDPCISSINGKIKLKFDDLRVENKSASSWIIRNSNGIVKIVASRHIDNVSIIIAECIILSDDLLTGKNIEFLNLKIENDSKILFLNLEIEDD